MKDEWIEDGSVGPNALRRGAAGIVASPCPPSAAAMEALRAGLAAAGAAVAICDAEDRLVYANDLFRAAFCPAFDGRPRAFLSVVGDAIRDGTGIRLTTASPEAFHARVAARRRDQKGALSFPSDTADGRWWWVTDTKLPSGWMLTVGQDISSLKRDEFVLRDAHANALAEARTDELTGAPNRRYGMRRAEEAVAVAHADGRGLVAALMDIDHFKAINDRHGHDAGDGALRHFVRVVAEGLGLDDELSRIGGDEFLLVTRAASAGELERSLGAAFAAMPPLLLPGLRESLRLSVSVGIASLRPHETWPDLLRRADEALYAAKTAGRDRIARAA